MTDRREAATRVSAQRERHAARPVIVRVAVALAGFLLGLAGLVLVVPLPEGGIPLLLLALRLLALEFGWAAHGYAWLLGHWERFRLWWRNLPGWLRYGSTVLLALVVVAAIWWAISGP